MTATREKGNRFFLGTQIWDTPQMGSPPFPQSLLSRSHSFLKQHC